MNSNKYDDKNISPDHVVIKKGETGARINSLAELSEFTLELCSLAKRKIQIYSHNLDPRLLNNKSLELVLKEFALSSRFAQVELLIYDEKNLQNVDHRLVKLAQQLTSNIQIRLVPEDFQRNLFGFYLIDQKKMLYRPVVNEFVGEYLALPDPKVRHKAQLFDEIWQQSPPASGLRALFI